MDAKAAAQERLEGVRARLIELSHQIQANPELGFQEHQAAGWLAELLAAEGLSVETGVCGLETAFVARAGSGPLHVAICAEYDCLPGIGHACGHNIIAAAGAGAGIALARVADEAGLTDMGNVSLVIPSIHPMIGINSWPAVNHQPEFAEHCATPAADQAVFDGALAMAWTAIDIARDERVRARLLSQASAK